MARMRTPVASTLPASRARLRRSALLIASGAAWGIGCLAPAAHGQFVWVAPASGNFGTAANWQGNVAPPSNNPSTSLTFNAGNIGAAITATNNIGSPFQVNGLTFNSFANPAFTVAGGAGNQFQMTGPAPSITLSGNNIAAAALSATGGALQLTADTVINGSGMGGLSFAGAISDDFGTSGIRRSLTISGAPATQNSRVVIFNNIANTFSGGLNLDGGIVGLTGFVNNGALGPAGSTVTVTANGGVLQILQSTIVPTASQFRLDGRLRVMGPTSLSLVTTQLVGAGELLINPSTANAVSIGHNAAGYTGTVTLDRHDLPQFSNVSGNIILTGAAGSLPDVSTLNARAGTAIVANNASSGAAANSDRIRNSATLNLASGRLSLSGTGSSSSVQTNVTEVVGTVNGAGMSTLSAESSSGAANSVSINVNGALNRVDRGTFLFRGLNLGAGTLTANGTLNGDGSQNFDGAVNTGYIVLPASTGAGLVGGGGAAGSNSVSVLPYAVADSTNTATGGTTLVTLAPIGGSSSLSVRPLAVSEYATDLISGAATNARLTAATPNAGASTVNALVLASAGAVDGSVTGAGTLNVTSGVILAAQTNAMTSIANGVNFGAAEGHIHTPGTGGLTISGSLTGSGGLTKSGGGSANTLFLTGDNTGLTGQLTINSGVINVNSANALPGTGTIVTNGTVVATTGGAVGLHYSGSTPLTLSRDIAANNGWLTVRALDAGIGGSVTLAGRITGNAGVNLQGVLNGAEVWVTGTSNTYTGPTRLSTGNVHIAGDGSLGLGGGVDFAATTLVLEGDWTTSRHLNFSAASTINTNGRNAAFNGPMTSFLSNSLNNTPPGGFTKTGAGTLSLNSTSNTVTGVINVNGGTLLVNGSLGASTANAVTVASGATLGGTGEIYRNISVAAGGTLSPGASPGILTIHGNVTLAATAGALFELAGAAPGNGAGNHDQLVVNGSVSLSGAILSAVMNYHASTSDVFWLVLNDGGDAVTGTFAGLAEGATVNLGVYGTEVFTAQISYTGNFATGMVDGSGNDIVLYNVVPAPGAAGLLMLAGCVGTRRRRTAV